jgi:hypothetical protein
MACAFSFVSMPFQIPDSCVPKFTTFSLAEHDGKCNV